MKKPISIPIFRRLKGKSYRYLLMALMCISILMVGSTLIVFLSGRSNTERYRRENYEKLRKNIDSFSQLLDQTDSIIETLESTKQSTQYFAEATGKQIDSMVKGEPEPGILWLSDTQSFIENSMGHKLLSWIRALVTSSTQVDAIILYAPTSGYSLGAINAGERFFMAHNDEELSRVFNTPVRFKTALDKSLIFAPGMRQGTQTLYYLRRLHNGMIALLGLNESALMDSLYMNNAGRSYKVEQMVMHLPNGGLGYRDENKKIDFIGRTWDVLANREDIFESNTYTVMRYASDTPAYTLSVIMSETGATGLTNMTFFVPFLITNILWLCLVTFLCIFVLMHFNYPIEEILRQIGPAEAERNDLSEVNQLALVGSAIQKYHQNIRSTQEKVEEQRRELKHIYLGKLALDQNTYLSDQQLEVLRIPQLLARYILIVIYPDNGRWTDAEGSEQEQAYQRHVTIMAVLESMRAGIMLSEAEYLICHTRLLIVVPIGEEEDTQALRDRVMESAARSCSNMGRSMQIGICKVYCGRETFSHAYRNALRTAVPIGQGDASKRTEGVNLSELLKQNMHIADLIYIEHYSGALTGIRAVIHAIMQQQHTALRRQQMQSFLSLILCMLTESSEINNQILDEANLTDLVQTDNEERLLNNWGVLFERLEDHKSVKKISQYTEQFAAVYQYMHTHFRNPDLSLSLLASEFGMSPSTLSREFQKNLGKGFLESLHQMRVDAARYEIEHSNVSLSSIAEAVGYTNALTMTRAFKKYLGNTPGAYRKGEADINTDS